MKELTIKVKIYDIENISKYKEMFKSDPTFFHHKGECGAICGNHTYDFDTADTLREMSAVEIEQIKKIAKIKYLKKRLLQLEQELGDCVV